MDNHSIIIKVLLNRVLFKLMLINTGYEDYSIMDKNCDGVNRHMDILLSRSETASL